MTYRDLTALSNTSLFQDFINDFNLEYKIIEDKLCIKNDCLLLLIYGFYVEDILYFDFYKIKEKTYAHIGRLISESNEKNEMKNIYTFFNNNHIKPVGDIMNPNTIKAERYFMTYIRIISKYLSDLLCCKLKEYNKYFEPIPEIRQKEFEDILNKFVS